MTELIFVEKGSQSWDAWREWYKNNKLFSFFPHRMTTTGIWPPTNERDVAQYVDVFVRVKVDSDDSSMRYDDKVRKYTPDPFPVPYRRPMPENLRQAA